MKMKPSVFKHELPTPAMQPQTEEGGGETGGGGEAGGSGDEQPAQPKAEVKQAEAGEQAEAKSPPADRKVEAK